MNNLAELKRYLAQPNAALRMTSLAYLKDGEWVNQPLRESLAAWRTVAKLQTNSVALNTADNKSGKSWLDFGKASQWTFDNENNRMVNQSGNSRLAYEWATIEGGN